MGNLPPPFLDHTYSKLVSSNWFHHSLLHTLSLELSIILPSLPYSHSKLLVSLPPSLTPFPTHSHLKLLSSLRPSLTLTQYRYHPFLPHLLYSDLVPSLPSLLTLTQVWYHPSLTNLLSLKFDIIPPSLTYSHSSLISSLPH